MNPLGLISSLFNVVFFEPVINLLVVVLHLLSALHIPGALGIAIIILTILIRLLVWPFMSAQMKSAKKMSELKPHMDKLKEKHGKDQQELAKAQMALYKEHGINPAAGCLPSLIQLPIIIALYQTIFLLFNPQDGLKQINNMLYPFISPLQQIPNPDFLGINLSHKPSEFLQYGWILLLIPVLTAGLQFVQSLMMSSKPVKEYPSDSPKEKKEKEKNEDMMVAMQSQMMYMMPLMVGFFSWQFPIGLALYWNTFTIFGILQQYQVAGLGGLETWLKKLQKKKT